MMKRLAFVLAILALCVAGLFFLGASRWTAGTRELRARLAAARLPRAPTTHDARETEDLPPPVRRYFHMALQDGQPLVSGVRLSQEWQLRQGDAEDSRRPFRATHVVTTRPPGFDWDARIPTAPGVDVFMHDAYVTGAGLLHAAVAGLITAAEVRGTPEVAQGELLRYLGEAAWYPTALLPSQGVRWEAVDDEKARATLTDGATTASLDVHFDAQGLIASVWTPSRYRTVGRTLEAAAWEGRFTGYADRGGMRVPLDSEVEWQLPHGPLPCWRGHTTAIAYDLAR